jgi:hypothetical protein
VDFEREAALRSLDFGRKEWGVRVLGRALLHAPECWRGFFWRCFFFLERARWYGISACRGRR